VYGIDDPEIKRLVLAYQEEGGGPVPEAILKKISGVVMDYPARVFCRNFDDCSDYYEYVTCRLPGILKGYRQTGALFTTWFLVVLRNQYLNWLKKNEARERVVRIVPRPGGELGPADMVNLRRWKEREQDERAPARTGAFRTWFRAQKPERKLLMGLLFGECDPVSLRAVMADAEKAAELYAEYQSFSRKARFARERIFARLSACQEAVVRLEKNLYWLDRTILEPDEHAREAARTKARMETWKRRLEKWLRRLGHMRYNTPYGWVSRVTGWPIDRIKRQLAAIRAELGRVLGMEGKK
jgi:DNA-directed RNA polymerase specialized sigma24 family protein